MTSNEKRQHVRHPASYEVNIRTSESGVGFKSERLHDISDAGISFNTEIADKYQIGQSLEVCIAPPDRENSIISLQGSGSIVWIEHDPFKPKQATIGIHFDTLIESDKLICS